MMSSRAPKVLMIAPGCDGTDVGESWSCFQWAKGISEHCDLTVLTLRRHSQNPLARQLPNARVVDWPDLPLVARFERFNSLLKPGYVKFYVQARRWLKQQLSSGNRFDLVHQVGPIALRYPCPAAGLGLPLIVGPLAGSLTDPAGFSVEQSQIPWYCRLRNIDQQRLKYDSLLRHSYASADIVLGVAPYVEELLRDVGIRRFELASETGVCELRTRHSGRRVFPGELRLAFVGRLIRTKGVRELIRAFKYLPDLPRISLTIAGEGIEETVCRREATLTGVGDRIRFLGRVSRDRVQSLYQQSDVFAFPSFREPSGNVVFEAMGNGLPVITTNRGGPAFVVDDNCGIRLPVSTPARLSQDLAMAIRQLSADPIQLQKLSEGALKRIAEIGLWSSKIDHMLGLYRELVTKPALCA